MRDPLSHFVAGYTEALSRGRVNHGNRTWTVQQVRQFLKALVTGSNNSVHILGSERYHYMPMSRIANFQPLVCTHTSVYPLPVPSCSLPPSLASSVSIQLHLILNHAVPTVPQRAVKASLRLPQCTS